MYFSDESLIEEITKKNPSALEYLMETYGKSVYKLVYRILDSLGVSEDIEECVSDIFVFIWNNVHQYNMNKGSFKTWIHIVAKYKALDYRRKLKKNRYFDTIDNFELVEESSVESKILSEEAKKEIIKAISEMGDTDRHIFLQRYFYYEPIESIAKKIGLTRQAVDNRLWRGRKILRDKLFQERKDDNI